MRIDEKNYQVVGLKDEGGRMKDEKGIQNPGVRIQKVDGMNADTEGSHQGTYII